MTLDLVKKRACCNCTGNHMTFDLVKNHALNLVIKTCTNGSHDEAKYKVTHIYVWGVVFAYNAPVGQNCYSAWKELQRPIERCRTVRNVKVHYTSHISSCCSLMPLGCSTGTG